MHPAIRFWLATTALLIASTAFAADPPPAAAAPPVIAEQEVVPTISWKDAAAHMDQEVYVVGKVARTGKSRTGHVFLNFDAQDRTALTVFIRQSNVAKFEEDPAKLYRGAIIKVHGFIYSHEGAPNIAAAGPQDIQILPPDSPLPASAAGKANPPATAPAADGTVTIATYNILNLFDNIDDPYRADTPSDVKPRAQLEAVAKSIRALNADVLALVEIENRPYLERFNKAFLGDLGYGEVVLFEGNDNRGIDVALLSRLPVGPVTSHRHVTFMDGDDQPSRFRRDLLQVRILPPGGRPFDVFVVHFKSKEGTDESDTSLGVRLAEARAARAILDGVLKADPQASFVICGDFNDLYESSPVKTVLGSGPTALKSFVDELPAEGRVSFNQKPHLSMIDFIFASPAMAANYVPQSYKITTGGSPDATGSDHNPVSARFRVR